MESTCINTHCQWRPNYLELQRVEGHHLLLHGLLEHGLLLLQHGPLRRHAHVGRHVSVVSEAVVRNVAD